MMRRVLAIYDADQSEHSELALGRSILLDRSRLSTNTATNIGVRDDVIAIISHSREVIALAKRVRENEERLQPTVVLPECKMSGK